MLRKSINHLAAIISGIFAALTFPCFNLSYLAWISYVPLLLAVFNSRSKDSFILGLTSSTASFLIILYWLVPTFIAAGEPAVLGVITLLLLSITLSAFTGLACSGISFLFGSLKNGRKIIFIAPAFWTASEFLRTYLFSGFPWALAGHSQWYHTRIIQIADITGVYGVSFFILTVNALIAFVVNETLQGKKITRAVKKTIPHLIVTISILIFVNLYGAYSIKKFANSEKKSDYKVALLQGNVDQYKKWDKKFVKEIFSTYEYLSTVASKSVPEIIIWPESSLPGIFSADKKLQEETVQLIQRTKTNHLIGAVEYEEGGFYNSALLFKPGGELSARYDKVHLVPFGETIPFKSFLGKFFKTLNELGEINPGKTPTTMDLNGVKFGATICFESIFPDISRKLTRRGAEFLVNLTNDAWYLNTSAPHQHFIFNIFRAVENRRPLLRCANTGISGEIDACGRIVSKTNVFIAAVLISEIKIPEKTYLSFYTRYGDLFSGVCLIISIAFILTKFPGFRRMNALKNETLR